MRVGGDGDWVEELEVQPGSEDVSFVVSSLIQWLLDLVVLSSLITEGNVGEEKKDCQH